MAELFESDELNVILPHKEREYGAEDKAETQQIIEEKMTFGTIDLSSEDLRNRAYQAVKKRMEAVRARHDDFVKLCNKWEQMWKMGSVEKDKETLANVPSTDVFNLVEDWTAMIMDAVFGVTPPFDVKGKRKKLDNETKERIKKVLWNCQFVPSGGEEEAEMGVREGVKLGTFTFKTPYLLSEEPSLVLKRRPKVFNIGGLTVPVPNQFETFVETEIEIEDRPALKWVDIRNLYFRYDKKTWIVEKIVTTWSEIEKQARLYGLYGNLENAKLTSFPTSEETDRELKQQERIAIEPTDNLHTIDEEVMLYEAHHIPLYFKEDDPVPDELKGKKVLCIITIANDREVIRIQPTPFRIPPYIICPFFRQPGSELGIGIPQLLEKIVRDYNTRKNQSLDVNSLGIYCMTVANMRYIKKREQLKIRPNGVIELKDLPPGAKAEDVIAFVRPPAEYAQMAQLLLQQLQQEMARTARLKSVLSGEKIRPKATATETATMQREALKGIRIVLSRIDRNIFQEYFSRAYIMSVLNRQKSWLIEMEKQVPVLNPLTGQPAVNPLTGQPVMRKESVWEEVTPEQIYSDGIDIIMLGTQHMVDEAITQHKLMQAIDLAMKLVGPNPIKNDKGEFVQFNFFKALNDILYALDIEDVEDYWMPAPPPPPPMPAGAAPEKEKGMAPKAPEAPNLQAGTKPEDMTQMIQQAIQTGV